MMKDYRPKRITRKHVPSIPRVFENRQGFGSMAQDALKILPGIEPPRPLPAGKLIVK